VSRRRKSKRKADQPTPTPPVAPEATLGESPSPSTKTRQQLVLAITLAAIWWSVLIGLAAFTANPVTLNREQIRQANIVISAKVTDAEENKAVVDKVWRGFLDEGQVTINGLSETGAGNGQAYLIPLKRVGPGRFEIAQARFFNGRDVHSPQAAVRLGPALIYRRTDSSIARLELLLSEFNGR